MHLVKREGGIWHYWRRVPKRFADVDSRVFVKISLETRELAKAERAKVVVEQELEIFWHSLKRGGGDNARERYFAALERARLEGFEYRPAAELVQDVQSVIARLERLEAMGAFPADEKVAELVEDLKPARDALMGMAAVPELTLSTALDQFYTYTKDTVRKKSTDQVRRWKAPRLKAINNLIALIGDKPVSQITRQDALQLKSWWVERVVEEEYTPNSANKDIGHLAQVIDTLNDLMKLGLDRPFAKLRLSEAEQKTRPAFEIDRLRAMVLDPRKLEGLNEEAVLIIQAMVETGMRPIEICNLDPSDIVLKHNVPHVKIRPSNTRELKTAYSKRDIPLVGISLTALQAAPNGFPRYRDRSSQLSANINKFLRGHDLLPTEDHSLYSIRHTFQDRLTAVDMPDRVQTELMGHKFNRPKYGSGPTLEHKLEWLERIAITIDRTGNSSSDQPLLL
ncbi:integrase [Kaistia sp. 32K]|nr:integrase [Kaistia sp. 32K]